ncbi:unnamed protein product [Penicillium nalgiovense]|nr:unnamed protein product [Penicillium nalgiovense]
MRGPLRTYLPPERLLKRPNKLLSCSLPNNVFAPTTSTVIYQTLLLHGPSDFLSLLFTCLSLPSLSPHFDTYKQIHAGSLLLVFYLIPSPSFVFLMVLFSSPRLP